MQPITSSRPALAVTIPVYNHAALLPRALDALLSQSRLPDELIVLDDGSTDTTWAVIQDYASRHALIRPVRNERNLGTVHGLNKLLQLANCQYVYCAAADDYVLPGFFDGAMRLAEAHPEAGLIFGGVNYHSPTDNQTSAFLHSTWREELYATPERVLSQWLRQLPVDHSFSAATIFRLGALKEVGGFRPELGAYSDAFAVQAIALKYGACYMPGAYGVFTIDRHGYWGRTASNFPLIMGIIDRAARLMTSPEFSDRFPRDYVVWWSREYRRSRVRSEVAHC